MRSGKDRQGRAGLGQPIPVQCPVRIAPVCWAKVRARKRRSGLVSWAEVGIGVAESGKVGSGPSGSVKVWWS